MTENGFNPPRAYLDLARACHSRPIDPIYGKPPSAANDDADQKEERSLRDVAFALNAQSVVFSYMTIEAFANCEIVQFWENGHPNLSPKLRDCKSLKCLKIEVRKHYRELSDKINLIFSCKGIRPIQESDIRLWEDFLDILKYLRHYFEHFTPDLAIPHERDEILEETPLKKYSDIAIQIMKHYHKNDSQ